MRSALASTSPHLLSLSAVSVSVSASASRCCYSVVLLAWLCLPCLTASSFPSPSLCSATLGSSSSVSVSGRPLHSDCRSAPVAMFSSRVVDVVVTANETPEGLGATVRRSIGGSQLRSLDPFLLLDHATIGADAGFPDHPHRGFETVSYNLPTSKGSFVHEDFTGKRGDLQPGDVQWMTAGRGIMHSEVPSGNGDCTGIQLWVNLRSKQKMVAPEYQDIRKAEIATASQGGVLARVIAGSALGVTAKTRTRTPTHYVHFELQPAAVIDQPIPAGWNALIYVLSGSVTIGGSEENGSDAAGDSVPAGPAPTPRRVTQFQAATLRPRSSPAAGDGVRVRALEGGAAVLFLAGEPINEPVVQYGPFVMNTQAEIQQAFRDFQMGRNGFERAVGWKSDVGARFRQQRVREEERRGKAANDNADEDEDDAFEKDDEDD